MQSEAARSQVPCALKLRTSQPSWASGADPVAALAQETRVLNEFGTADVIKPLVAAVNGYCLGAGLNLVATRCDIRIAGESALFGMPEVARGTIDRTVPFALEGLSRAFLSGLLFTGDPVSAQRAREAGLVNEVVPDDEVMPAAIRMAERIARHSPTAVRATKLNLLKTFEATPSAVAWEMRLRERVSGSNETREGMQAFVEKRIHPGNRTRPRRSVDVYGQKCAPRCSGHRNSDGKRTVPGQPLVQSPPRHHQSSISAIAHLIERPPPPSVIRSGFFRYRSPGECFLLGSLMQWKLMSARTLPGLVPGAMSSTTPRMNATTKAGRGLDSRVSIAREGDCLAGGSCNSRRLAPWCVVMSPRRARPISVGGAAAREAKERSPADHLSGPSMNHRQSVRNLRASGVAPHPYPSE